MTARAGAGPADIRLGDAVTLRKAHPCGSREWEVVRLGADVGLVCGGCGRRIMLTRGELARRLRAVGTGRETRRGLD